MIEAIMQSETSQTQNTNAILSYLYMEPKKAEFIETENGKAITEEQVGRIRKGPQDESQLGS